MVQLSLFLEPPSPRIVPVSAVPQVDGLSLFPGVLAEHFEIPGNFSNIANWRARSFFKGTMRKPFSGPMEEVGYVMIHQNGKHIVPIARGDEHHVGYDLMFEFWKKRVRALVPAEFLSFWGLGRNFIYSAEALPPFQRAANTWLSNGGGDSIVTGDYDGMNLTAMISDLVKGDFATGKAALSTETPISKRLCAAFAAISAGITKYQGAPTAGNAACTFRAADALVALLSRMPEHMLYMDADEHLARVVQTLAECRAHDDPLPLEARLFSFGGLKNAIHLAMKGAVKGKGSFDSNIRSLFGDIEAASARLASI